MLTITGDRQPSLPGGHTPKHKMYLINKYVVVLRVMYCTLVPTTGIRFRLHNPSVNIEILENEFLNGPGERLLNYIGGT